MRKGSNTNLSRARKPASRKNSRTILSFSTNQRQNTTNDETCQLGDRILQLEQQVRSHTHPKRSAQSSTGNTETNYQKNVNTAQNLDKGTTPNVDEMLKYIESTMQVHLQGN